MNLKKIEMLIFRDFLLPDDFFKFIGWKNSVVTQKPTCYNNIINIDEA